MLFYHPFHCLGCRYGLVSSMKWCHCWLRDYCISAKYAVWEHNAVLTDYSDHHCRKMVKSSTSYTCNQGHICHLCILRIWNSNNNRGLHLQIYCKWLEEGCPHCTRDVQWGNHLLQWYCGIHITGFSQHTIRGTICYAWTAIWFLVDGPLICVEMIVLQFEIVS